MKLSTGLSMLGTRNVEKDISKKILMANTFDKLANNRKITSKAISTPSDPLYFQNSNNIVFNPDIRYQNTYGYAPLTHITYRNDLLVFSENNEIKKACEIISNETVVKNLKSIKYPVYPTINMTLVPKDKKEVAAAMQKYLDEVFYPKLWQFSDMKNDGLWETVNEFLKTGKLAYEIIYDSIENPTEILGLVPIDPSTLQKFKKDGLVWYVQKPIVDTGRERILSDNQVILIEYNKYDYGYISYVDKLRRPFNIMRSMMTSKILWFASKSQVRMHINLNLGDVSRTEATTRLSQLSEELTNSMIFNDVNGQVLFNGSPNNVGYKEFFTGTTPGNDAPSIEEVNTNGPNLEEIDSLMYWEKYFWKNTDIPFDRIDPNASDTWGFLDVTNIRKIELNFSKMIEFNRNLLSEIFLKPIIIQFTLQEVNIGADLSLLDLIKMEWVAFNEYEKLGELELMNKKIELCTNMINFGQTENAAGQQINRIPLEWIIKNYLDFTQEQLESMEEERKKEYERLGFNPDGSPKEELEENLDDEENGGDDFSFEEDASHLGGIDNEVL